MSFAWRRHSFLIICAIAALIVFCGMELIPILSGSQAEAVKHAADRKAAEEAALRFVQERIGEEAELDAFSIYSSERIAFGYLYKEGLIQQVMDDLKDVLPLEYYRVEVKDSETGNVHYVDINPYTAQPAEWDLQLSGRPLPAAELERIAAEAAAGIAGDTLKASLVHTDAEAGEVTFRLDHASIGGAEIELTVRADTAGVNGVTVAWSVPPAYVSLVERQDQLASWLSTAATVLSGIMQLAAVIYVFAHIKQVRLARGVVMSLVFAAFYSVININMYPAWKGVMLEMLNGETPPAAGLESPESLLAGLISMLLITNLFTLTLAIGMYFSAVAGDLMIKQQGWKLWPEWRSEEYGGHVYASVWKGYLFAVIMLGLQAVIYIGAESGFRTWYTIDAMTSANNLLYPFLMPLLAWCAAVSEEAIYRLLGISLLKKLFRFTFPAVLVSSIIWAAMHVSYPVYPFYTRLVEVTLIGIAFSYIYLKHGFLTAIYAHAVVDIIWMGLAIVAHTPTPLHWAAFLLNLIAPAAIAVIVRWRHQRRRLPQPAV